MTREAASRIKALLREAYPSADITARRTFDGLAFTVEVRGGRLTGVIADEQSILLEAIAAGLPAT